MCVTGGKKHLFKISKMFSHRVNMVCKCFACYLFCWNVVQNVCLLSLGKKNTPNVGTANQRRKKIIHRTEICKWIQKLIVTVSLVCFSIPHIHNQIKSKMSHLDLVCLKTISTCKMRHSGKMVNENDTIFLHELILFKSNLIMPQNKR